MAVGFEDVQDTPLFRARFCCVDLGEEILLLRASVSK